MESFFENARQILDVAATASSNGPDEFAVLMSRDGGMRILMNQAFRLDAAAADAGADAAYRVVRSASGVRVEGHAFGQDCLLETRVKQPARAGSQAPPPAQWLRHQLLDQPLYRITSPLLTSATSAC